MKKKIFILVSSLFLIATAVSASSLNGDYKGNPIVNVNVNGKTISSEVPAQIIDGNTLLPLRSVSEALGADVKWNQDTYSVDVNKKDNFISVDEFKRINSDIQAYRTFLFMTDQYELAQICIGLVRNSTTLSDMAKAQFQVDRINSEGVANNLSLINFQNSTEKNTLEVASDRLRDIKASLKAYLPDNANNQWMSGKETLNKVYSTLDSRLSSEVSKVNVSIFLNENK